MRILVTGGAGYIGSHTCIELLQTGYQVVVLDDLSNSKLSNLENVSKITNIELKVDGLRDCEFSFIEGNVCDESILNDLFSKIQIDGVIHFAGLKAVAESVEKPIHYYQNNVVGAITLINSMKKFHCKTFVFSSSAAVYGKPHMLPIKETFPLKPNNPYGQSKLIVENILRDLSLSDKSWKIAILRYFNPIGAHISGLVGDNPINKPNNLVPFISKVAVGEYSNLIIFGGDYDTHDGTGVRDYIHVVDLAKSHVKSLKKIKSSEIFLTLNIGTGRGYSVLDLVEAFEKVSKKKIPYKIEARRAGDVAKNFADPTLAKNKIGWKAENSLEKMCADSWNFQQKQLD